jgi:hypothetical protein
MSWTGGLGKTVSGIDHKFCKRACLKAWEAGMALSGYEIEAIQAMLPAMGEYVASNDIGGKAFNDLSRDEVLGLFATTIKAFRVELDAQLSADVPY